MAPTHPTPSTPESSVAANKALIRALYDAVNARDDDALRRLCSPAMGEWLTGAVRTGWGRFDASWEILDLIAEGDRVAVKWRREGRYSGDYQGIPVDGQHLSHDGVRLWRIENGRVAESYAATNHVPVLRQLGVLPAAQGQGGS